MHALRKQPSLTPGRQQSPCTQATSNSGPCRAVVSTTSRAVADRGSPIPSGSIRFTERARSAHAGCRNNRTLTTDLALTRPVRFSVRIRFVSWPRLIQVLLRVFYERALKIPKRVARYANPPMHGGTAPVITCRTTNERSMTSRTLLRFYLPIHPSSSSTVSLLGKSVCLLPY